MTIAQVAEHCRVDRTEVYKYFAPVWRRIAAPDDVFVADYLKPENQW
jgi:hypothetical protein